MFGIGTLDRPWLADSDEMAGARYRMAVAFEFFGKLGIPFYCFHDRDVAPEGDSFATFRSNLDALVDDALGYQERTGVKLLWGTANLFTHPRYQGGASTNPDPAVFAYAAAQVKHMLEVTKRLGGENYVLWGGREGYDTLLNTDLKREQAQLARFLHLVAEHKRTIGFTGQLLIEPKPMEPTKHQYDTDVQTVYGFLVANGLEDEYRVNIEANHATLAGKSFHHEVAFAVANGILGSIDANRGDPQNGWDTDQFPNSVDDLVLPLFEIIRNGGLGVGGFNFDAKLRRQSSDRTDLFHAHIGGLDTLAMALLAAADLVERGELAALKDARYADWDGALGRDILGGSLSLADLEERVASGAVAPVRHSGAQERLENIVNQSVWRGPAE
jgi:xylose isomerase